MGGGDPIPVTLIGGYLGAGKTTLVNHLLRHAGGRRLAVLVNEFGALPIDADLIEAEEKDGIIAIAGGCICCSYGSDLVEALVALSARSPRPDHILIETSGVALPGGVAQSLSLIGGVRLDAVAVIADAETVRERSGDRYLADTIARQLGEADIVVLNKADLVTCAQVDAIVDWMGQRWPLARVVTATRAVVDPQVLIGADVRPQTGGALRLPTHVTTGYVSIGLEPTATVDAQVLGRALAQDVAGLVRAKGFVVDPGLGVASLQVVGRRFDVKAAAPTALGEAPFGRLVAIGLAGVMAQREVEAALDAAVVGVEMRS